jgi:hypothetical protein
MYPFALPKQYRQWIIFSIDKSALLCFSPTGSATSVLQVFATGIHPNQVRQQTRRKAIKYQVSDSLSVSVVIPSLQASAASAAIHRRSLCAWIAARRLRRRSQ